MSTYSEISGMSKYVVYDGSQPYVVIPAKSRCQVELYGAGGGTGSRATTGVIGSGGSGGYINFWTSNHSNTDLLLSYSIGAGGTSNWGVNSVGTSGGTTFLYLGKVGTPSATNYGYFATGGTGGGNAAAGVAVSGGTGGNGGYYSVTNTQVIVNTGSASAGLTFAGGAGGAGVSAAGVISAIGIAYQGASGGGGFLKTATLDYAVYYESFTPGYGRGGTGVAYNGFSDPPQSGAIIVTSVRI